MNLKEKDRFNYYAVALIFGLRSPHMSKYQSFSTDLLHKHQDIKFLETSALSTNNIMDTYRKLAITPSRSFSSSNCELVFGISKVITYRDIDHKINISDSIFSEQELRYYGKSWNKVVKNKINALGLLIRSVYEGKMNGIPLLINEYKHITGILLEFPGIWVKD